MKKALKTWWLYLIGFGLSAIIAAVNLGFYFIGNDPDFYPFQFISYVFFFGAVVSFGIAFIVQDLYRAGIRHKTKNWADKLPEQNLNFAWRILLPGIVCAVLCIIAGIIHSFPAIIYYPSRL